MHRAKDRSMMSGYPLGVIAFDSTRIVGPNSGRMTGYSKTTPGQKSDSGKLRIDDVVVRVWRDLVLQQLRERKDWQNTGRSNRTSYSVGWIGGRKKALVLFPKRSEPELAQHK